MNDPLLMAYVAGRTGLNLAGAQQRRVDRVVSRACVEAGLTPRAYAELLRREQPAFDALADDLTVGETYFFRERPQLGLLRDAVSTERPAIGPLRAWSAGCSTGEEAYTLAMLFGPAAGSPGVEVLGTDLSRSALARAERATYGERALRAVPDAERGRWFQPGTRGQMHVREFVRRAVRFSHGNLLEGPPEPRRFDVVLCRNVLIYLSPDAVQRVAATLRDALLPSGWLLTGVADPVLEAEGLVRIVTPEGVVYRRGGRASRAPARPHPPRVRRAAAADAARPAPAPAAVPAATPTAAANGSSSIAAVRAAVETCPVDAALRYRLAVLHLEEGDLPAAAESATAAAFLEPTFIVAHLLLGRIHEALREAHRAHRCFRTAAALLDQLPGHSRVPHADGETAESLARVVGAALGRPLPPGQRQAR